MSFTYNKKGKTIYLESVFPLVPKRTLYEITSDRNYVISRMSDISPLDPDRRPGTDRYPQDTDSWFAVVDLWIEPGMYAQVSLSDDYGNGIFYCNSYKNPDPIVPVRGTGTIDGKWLSQWENSLYLLSKTARITRFALYKEAPALPAISRKRNTVLTCLSEDWGGTIKSWYEDENGELKLLGELRIERPATGNRLSVSPHLPMSEERDALNGCLEYILGSQNHDPASPQKEGLYLFYDLDADTYRNGQWPWSWGIAIKLLLEASRLDPALLKYSPEELREAAWRIGNASLRFQISHEGHPAHHFGATRYTVRTNEKAGYQELVNTGSDTGFLAGWGWIPLYEETGDKRFLKAAENYINVLYPVLRDYKLPPQEWLPAQNNWTDFTIDESGFGTEGIAALFQIKKDPASVKLCLDYIDKHLAVFERSDGLWNRQYTFSTGKTEPTECMTRGLGWAMESLLAAWRCTGDSRFLEKAQKMAAVLLSAQRPDGSWSFKFDRDPLSAGTADKGTALWCLLLYMLNREKQDAAVLAGARRALQWCMANQYKGPNSHARGGIVGVSGESGITYRHWFRLCCQYTSAFFGLALLEEIKSQKKGKSGNG